MKRKTETPYRGSRRRRERTSDCCCSCNKSFSPADELHEEKEPQRVAAWLGENLALAVKKARGGSDED